MSEAINENLYQLFARQVDATPSAVAVIDSAEHTYAELAKRVDQIAYFLRQRGIENETPVGVLMSRSADMVASLLGILAAGGSYVPCDPEHPIERTLRMLKVAECPIVLCDQHSKDACAELSPQLESLLVESIAPTLEQTHFSARQVEGNQRAYILFTSGSTGLPKGVEVEHHSLVSFLLAIRDLIDFTDADRFLATSTLTFDISIAEIFLPLITGGSLVLRNRTVLLEPKQLAREILKHRITVVQTGPSVWSVILQQAADLPPLRIAISTGEAISPDLAARLIPRAGQAWNLYGPTEATVWATGQRLAQSPADSNTPLSTSAPIGQPLANTDTLIVDAMGIPVPEGEHGELWLAGAGIARGYCQNPALTRDRFVLGLRGRRYYRTGDRVSRVDGILHYFGRYDDQIQIHGVRIEPREVEMAILEDPAVVQAAVTWYQTDRAEKALGAAIVVSPDAPRSAAERRRALAHYLPSPMIPSRITIQESIPLLTSGKVDHEAIRRLLSSASPKGPSARTSMPTTTTSTTVSSTTTLSTTTRTRTAVEQALGEILEHLLGIQRADPDDLFLQLGGESLTAFRLLIEIEAAFAVQLRPVEVFDLKLGEIASRIEELQAQSSPPAS